MLNILMDIRLGKMHLPCIQWAVRALVEVTNLQIVDHIKMPNENFYPRGILGMIFYEYHLYFFQMFSINNLHKISVSAPKKIKCPLISVIIRRKEPLLQH